MITLLFLILYAAVGLVTFPVATRVVYNREAHKYSNPLLAYRDALVVGGACGAFWPVAVPVAVLGSTAGAVARMTAPPEVKKLITEHNTRMLEKQLGMHDEPREILSPDDIVPRSAHDWGA